MKSLQLKMTVPRRALGRGSFIDSNIVSAKLSRKRGLERDEYEKMVLGKWSWSNDGKTHEYFIVFNKDNTCSFQNLDEETIQGYKGFCQWKIQMKSLQLIINIPMAMTGSFTDSNILSAKLTRMNLNY